MSQPAIVVDGVSKRFRLYHDRNQSLKATILRRGRAKYDDFWALRDVSFEVPQGSTFGLIGENGSGKSTMLKCIANILTPEVGTITRNGRMAALLELGSGFHPELSGRENVYLNGSILGLNRKEIDRAFDSIVEFSGVEQFIDQPVKNYSSGMYVRLGFAIAIHIEPEILLVDEILAVGDAAFQRKCMEKFAQFRDEGKTVVIVSHAMGSMKDMCDQVAWLEHGKLMDAGSANKVVDEYVSETTVDRIQPTDPDQVGEESGAGPIRLYHPRLINEAGAESSRLRTGERVRVRFSFDTSEPVESPIFGMAFDTLDGSRVWSHHTKDDGQDFGVLSGSGTIELEIPRLLLNPGVFDVTVNVADKTRTHEYWKLKDCIRFDVVPGDHHEGDGFVIMDAHFRCLEH